MVNISPERSERIKVRVKTPTPDHISAWWRHRCATEFYTLETMYGIGDLYGIM
jgi:hypothetical protein